MEEIGERSTVVLNYEVTRCSTNAEVGIDVAVALRLDLNGSGAAADGDSGAGLSGLDSQAAGGIGKDLRSSDG